MCEQWARNKHMEGAKWVPRYMSVGQEACFDRTVIGFSEREDCICCTTPYVGPGTTCMKLVAHYDQWRGDHAEARGYDDVIRITAVSGPGKGESWYYAKGYGWVGYERRPPEADPFNGPIADSNYARESQFEGVGWSWVCSDGGAAPPPPPPPPGANDLIIEALSKAPEVGGDKPWEGDGITAAWVNRDGHLSLISGDRFWVLRLSDRKWIAWGPFDSLSSNHLWMRAPHDQRVDFQRPWEGEGLTAGWVNGDGYLGATSKDIYWVEDQSSRQWLAWGKYADLSAGHIWKQAPRVEGQYPWEGAGITAGWFEDSNGWVVAISKNRYWTQDFAGRTWLWWGKFDDLPLDHIWKRAPQVGGHYPWEGDGITAGFAAEERLYIFSRDRYWVRDLSGDAWIASGRFDGGGTPPPPPPPSEAAALRIINGDQNPDIWRDLWVTQCIGAGKQRVWQVDATRNWAPYQGIEAANQCGEPRQGVYPLVFRWSEVNNQPGTWITWCTGSGDEEWVWIPNGTTHAPFAYPQHDNDGSCSR